MNSVNTIISLVIIIILCLGLGFGAGWYVADRGEGCFEGYVTVYQEFPDAYPSPITKSIIGDSTFCGSFGNVTGPSKLHGR